MAQKFGDGLSGLIRRLSLLGKFHIPFRRPGVAQAVKGHGPGGASILGIEPVGREEGLEIFDRFVGGFPIENEQFLPAGRGFQMFFQSICNDSVQRDSSHQAALAFDGESGSLDGLCRCGGVHAEAFVDAQSGIAAQVQNGDVVLPPRTPASD